MEDIEMKDASTVSPSSETLALLLHMKWLNRILSHGKTWEIRGRDTKIRGKIFLAFKNHIYGETHVVDSFPITMQELQDSTHRHHVEDLTIVKYKTPHVWMLQNTKRYPKRIQFTRKPGQVVWCKVNTNITESIQNNKDHVIVEHNIDLSQRLTETQWNSVEDSLDHSCCNKKVGGISVLCDDCDSSWHIYCLKYNYHINDTEMDRIQQDGQPFTCMDCHRLKLILEKMRRRNKQLFRNNSQQKESGMNKSECSPLQYKGFQLMIPSTTETFDL
eukprot:62555_1